MRKGKKIGLYSQNRLSNFINFGKQRQKNLLIIKKLRFSSLGKSPSMQQILYRYCIYPLFYLVSKLPWRVLYTISDFVFVLVYYLFPYRKKVVLMNLSRSFPEKSERERKKIARDHYRYLIDSIFEAIKKISVTESVLRERVKVKNLDQIQQLYDQGKSIVVVMGHYGNWELGGARVNIEAKHPLVCIYKKLHNEIFDQLLFDIRSRFGTELVEARDTPRSMLANRDRTTAVVFLADQTPLLLRHAHWIKFLNQDTPVYQGTAQLAQKFDYPVVYFVVRRPKRGFYEVDFELLVEEPNTVSDLEISKRHTRRLEQDIKAQPELWMWTHRRWKRSHQKPKNVASID
ncbi:lipid A biosynthesis protein [Persicobacter psychrovividus]|uniref:Lipid A biosynthesis protein n=2 Tax=Persicobacter psychrovividus TaxID=387638 RepID=A0ABM7VBI2_9BACT|nr:lipid A biosynthesis protein [Persicobacter psychrovividus]